MASRNPDDVDKGSFIVIEGLDGVGKDTIIRGITNYLKQQGVGVFDITSMWKSTGHHPRIHSKEWILRDKDVFVSAEPTYVNVGAFIREELLPSNGRSYTALETAQAYALDRHEHLQRNVNPLLAQGKIVFQSRSYISSLIYQQVQGAGSLEVDDILSLPGNQYAQEHAPDFMLIPTIADFSELERRLHNEDRGGQDQFENLAFQKQLKPHYEGDWLKEYLSRVGTTPIYFDVGGPKQEAVHNAIRAYKQTTN